MQAKPLVSIHVTQISLHASAPRKNAHPPNRHVFLDDTMSQSELTTIVTKICYNRWSNIIKIRLTGFKIAALINITVVEIGVNPIVNQSCFFCRVAEDAVHGRDGYDYDGYKLRVEFPKGGGGSFRPGRSGGASYSGGGGGRLDFFSSALLIFQR